MAENRSSFLYACIPIVSHLYNVVLFTYRLKCGENFLDTLYIFFINISKDKASILTISFFSINKRILLIHFHYSILTISLARPAFSQGSLARLQSPVACYLSVRMCRTWHDWDSRRNDVDLAKRERYSTLVEAPPDSFWAVDLPAWTAKGDRLQKKIRKYVCLIYNKRAMQRKKFYV